MTVPTKLERLRAENAELREAFLEALEYLEQCNAYYHYKPGSPLDQWRKLREKLTSAEPNKE